MNLKVTIICPWWRRWEIVLQHCLSMEKFMQETPGWIKINYLCVVSREDPDFKELVDLGHRFGFTVTLFRNLPLGNKMNAAVNTAIKLFSPDYVMNMGSDDLCDASIWGVYKPYLEDGVELIGIDSCYIVDPATDKAFYLDLYNDKFPVGVLRMVKVSTIMRLRNGYKLELYHSDIDRGLDTASMMRLMKIGVEPTVVHTDWRPFTAGLKCNVSINHFMHLSSLEKAKPVEVETLKHLFPCSPTEITKE